MKLRPEDPMRARATDAGVEDGWRGARIGAERRQRLRHEASRLDVEVDIGEPEVPRVVLAFLVLTVLVTLAEFSRFGVSPGVEELARAGGSSIGAVATGAWWKLLVANLLHGNIVHLLMNAFVIYLMGRWLEHLVGGLLIAATIAWSALLASAGSLLLDSASVTIGASGVAFGLVGCAFAIDPRGRTAVGSIARPLLIANVIITFVVPGISIGGHLGGLAAGALVGWIGWDRRIDEQHLAGRPRRAVSGGMLTASLLPIALLAIGPRVLPGEAQALRGRVVAPLLARQLSGAELTGGLSIDEARCTPTEDPQRYTCTIDGKQAAVRFADGTDQWSLTGPAT